MEGMSEEFGDEEADLPEDTLPNDEAAWNYDNEDEEANFRAKESGS